MSRSFLCSCACRVQVSHRHLTAEVAVSGGMCRVWPQYSLGFYEVLIFLLLRVGSAGVKVKQDRPPHVLEGIRGRKVKTDAPRPLAHPRSDFEQAKPDRVEGGRRPARALQADLLQGVHEHVGGAVQKKTELIGREAMAGGAVRMQEGLVILDESFRPSARTIDLLIQKLGGSIRDVGGDKARIGLALGNLGLVEDALRALPALGLVVETGKEPHRLLFGALLGLSQRLLHQRRPEFVQLGVGSLAQDKRQAVLFAHLVNLRGAEVRVAPQGDLHLGPGLSNRRENTPQNRRRFAPLDAPTAAQNRRNQTPRVPFVEVHGHVAVFFMVGVEQRQLLRPMGDILGVIDVDDDLLRRLLVGCDKRVQQRARKAVEIAAADPVFQTRQGRLTGQIRARQRRPLAGGFQPRIAAQIVAVVGVLVAAGDLKKRAGEKGPRRYGRCNWDGADPATPPPYA